MGFGPLRNLVGPVARALLPRGIPACSPSLIPANPSSVRPEFRHFLASLHCQSRWTRPFAATTASPFNSLTDTQLPKRRPRRTGHKKKACSCCWCGMHSDIVAPHAMVNFQWIPPPPKPPKNRDEARVRERNAKKLRRQQRELKLSEKKKREAWMKAAKIRENLERMEEKKAAVARKKAWAQRLAEVRKIDEDGGNPRIRWLLG